LEQETIGLLASTIRGNAFEIEPTKLHWKARCIQRLTKW